MAKHANKKNRRVSKAKTLEESKKELRQYYPIFACIAFFMIIFVCMIVREAKIRNSILQNGTFDAAVTPDIGSVEYYYLPVRRGTIKICRFFADRKEYRVTENITKAYEAASTGKELNVVCYEYQRFLLIPESKAYSVVGMSYKDGIVIEYDGDDESLANRFNDFIIVFSVIEGLIVFAFLILFLFFLSDLKEYKKLKNQ